MCFPVALAIGSALISGAGSVMGGMMAQSQAKAQAAAYDRQAQLVTTQGEYEANRKQEQIDAITGTQIAGVAGSGVTLDGSPTDLITSSVSSGALDKSAIRWSAKVQSDTFHFDAQNARLQGQNELAGSILGGVGALVGGLGHAAGMMNPSAPGSSSAGPRITGSNYSAWGGGRYTEGLSGQGGV